MNHIPVLLEEVLHYLALAPGKFVIDGTVDGGGHARAIFERIKPNGRLLGIDWDERLIQNSTFHIPNSSSVQLVHGNYAELPAILAERKLPRADGLLLDLGFSSEQLESKRGFSFEKNQPLTMTYDGAATPVSKLLRELSEEELVKILREYGEERYAPRIAKAIKERLKKHPIGTTGELAQIVPDAVPKGYERGRIHPATRTFQALRIYANDELGNVKLVLAGLPEILASGGRAVILTFHSLEDRIVKHAFRDMAQKGILEIVTKKPVTASAGEIAANPRSRSAKLRAAVMRT
ncbi:MAG: 16S rRNA (cytosine(1402)-N(4))-methyltransferase RsmH [Candidatus Liptonbacteria bacterium]|nr:16S rRNA (cytosine(1402)-N(4))-methyltransferase RsmH [Candidatus Liptonbacteria bacterium]